MIKIAPSILSADFSCLRDEIRKIEDSGADMVHIDIMDGHFVPPITFGPLVVESIRPHTKLPFDVHLMIREPDKHIEAFKKAGADIITVHAETTHHLDRTIQLIKSMGLKAGASINPATHENALEYVLDKVDMVLLMTVNPGFGGQSLLDSVLKKLKRVREAINTRNLNIDVEVDGGINLETIDKAYAAGANVFVTGSAFFQSMEPRSFVSQLKDRKSL